LHEEATMAWRKVWKRRRKGDRKDAWLVRWYDDAGKMQAKTMHVYKRGFLGNVESEASSG
jgi:hypothetical protein